MVQCKWYNLKRRKDIVILFVITRSKHYNKIFQTELVLRFASYALSVKYDSTKTPDTNQSTTKQYACA